MQGQIATKSLKLMPCSDSWSGKAITLQGAGWLSISPTQGVFRNGESQSVSITVSADTLSVGRYEGSIRLTPSFSETLVVGVTVEVLPNQLVASLNNIVAYTPLSGLTVVATWPPLIKDQAVNLPFA